jgi:hypothetical protein
VVWLYFRAPRRHLAVDVTVTTARTYTNAPHLGARLPLPSSLALGAQHVKLDVDLHTFALLGTPSIQSVHDCYPFSLSKDWGPLAPMAVELDDSLANFVAFLRFPCMDAADSRSWRSYSYFLFVHLLMYIFDVFGGMCAENSCNIFLLLFMVLWGPFFRTLSRGAMLML